MFAEFFDFLCNSLLTVFDTMKKFELFEGFTYYNFCIGLFCIPIFIKLIHFIMGIEDEEPYYRDIPSQPQNGNYIPQFDGYAPQHYKTYKPKHGPYVPRHERKKRGWF